MVVARHAGGIEAGFFNDRAIGIGYDAGGAEVVLVVIASAKGGAGNCQFDWRRGIDVDRLSGRQRGGQFRDERQFAGESGAPLLGGRIV